MKTWWRGLGGLLLPCLLALMVFAPAIDAAICVGDTGAISTPVAEITSAAKSDHQPADHRDADDVCQHGHCHHSAPMLVAQLDAEPAHTSTRTVNSTLGARAALSLAPTGPERPPRA
jgi:hypothetical protein